MSSRPTRRPARAQEDGVEAGEAHHPEQRRVQDAGGAGAVDGRLEHVAEGEALVDGAQPLVGVVDVAAASRSPGRRRRPRLGHGTCAAPARSARPASQAPTGPARRLHRDLRRPPQLGRGPGPRVGPVAGGHVDAVGGERRLARQVHGPRRLRPRGQRPQHAGGHAERRAGRPAPLGQQLEDARRPAWPPGPPSTKTPSPRLTERATRPGDQVVDVEEVDPVVARRRGTSARRGPGARTTRASMPVGVARRRR